MKVILKQDVKGSGKKGDIVEVSDGYATNFLLKKGLAERASAININSINNRKEAEKYHKEMEIKRLKEICEKAKDAEITLKLKCGEGGRIFGSVNTKEIAEKLCSIGYEVDKKQIVLKEPIKSLGRFSVTVKFAPEISCKITLVVEQE